MDRFTLILSIVVLINLIILRTDAQLSPDEEDLQNQARDQAAQLLSSGRSTLNGPISQDFLDLAASRIEFHLNKRRAVEKWDSVPAPPLPESSMKSKIQSIKKKTRHLSTVGCGDNINQHNGRNLQQSSPCKVLYNRNFIGSTLSGGYNPNINDAAECCKACFDRADCIGWTVNNDSIKTNLRGCYLKGIGYKTKTKVPGYISGIISASRGSVDGSNKEGAVSPSPAVEVPSPSPTDQYQLPVDPSPPALPSPPIDAVPPVVLPPPLPPSPPYNGTNALPAGKAKYAEILGLSWMYYEAQRSGLTPSFNRIKWRGDSHINDPVLGGWYDAGDFLKLNFPLASTVTLLAWGILEFQDGYQQANQLQHAVDNLRIAADYLYMSYDGASGTYVGQIGDPNIDHSFWGRPEQSTNKRPTFVYQRGVHAASDLYGGVAAALAATSLVLRPSDGAYADTLLAAAKDLFVWGQEKDGKYSDYYKKQTYSIYPSSDTADNMAYAAGWLFHATKDPTYLAYAQAFFLKGKGDIYPGWDSVWVPHAVHMLTLSNQGVSVPGIEIYRDFAENKFLRAWIQANGYLEIVSTPKGLHYPKWNQWANLQFSTTAAAMALIHAKYTPDVNQKNSDISFARQQVDYAIGSGGRSFVIGWGNNPPSHAHHAAASCPDMPAKCGWPQFETSSPNPQILFGGLVAGPAGARKNAADPDDTYQDKRSDYVTNEVANDYNAGFNTALAGLFQLM